MTSTPRRASAGAEAVPAGAGPAGSDPAGGDLAQSAPPRRRLNRWGVLLLVAAIYLGLSFIPFWDAWSRNPSDYLQLNGSGDIGQTTFFMSQLPYALIHGLNPFANSWTDWPYGANYMDNTAVPLLALIMSPVTLATNPILSLNLLFVLTIFANAISAYLVIGVFVRNRFVAFITGLLYGFNPLVISASRGHVHVMFGALLPVLFLLVWKLCTQPRRPVLLGLLIGLVLAMQLYIFSEPLSDYIVIGGIGVVIAAVVHRRRLRAELARLASGAVAAAAAFIVLGGYGIYLLVRGPEHITGNPHGASFLTISSDLLSPVLPTSQQYFHFGLGRAHGNSLVGPAEHANFAHVVADGAENGSYIGVTLLVILLIGLVVLWRRPIVRWAAGLAVVSFVFSLGWRLRVNGHLTPIRLPFDVLAHISTLSGAIASRYAMVEWFFLALLLALELDALQRWLTARLSPRWQGRPQPGLLAGLGVLAVAVIALIPLVPAFPYGIGKVAKPSLIVDSAQIKALPAGDIVAGYPFPLQNTYLMVYQALNRMHYRLVGGSLIQPGPGGRNDTSAAPASVCQSTLNVFFQPVAVSPLSAADFSGCAQDLLSWGVQTVVWGYRGHHPVGALIYLSGLLGKPSASAPDSALWLHPQQALRADVADGGARAYAYYQARLATAQQTVVNDS